MSTFLSQLNGVGPKTEKLLKKIGLETLPDLLFYFPSRYEEYQESDNLNQLKIGQNINLKGEIQIISNRRSWKRKMSITEAIISTPSGSIGVIWFNQPFITKILKAGDQVSLAGKINLRQGRLMMVAPTYEKIFSTKENIHTQGLVPIYSLTKGLSQKQLRHLIYQALKKTKKIPDYLPEITRQRQKLLSLHETVAAIHFPANQNELKQAINRLKFSELFNFQLKYYFIKEDLKTKVAPIINLKLNNIKNFINSLPYQLSSDQKKCAWEILQDLEKEKPMSRVLQGDVGSGKTIVALISILNTIKNNYQSALMVPSEILAKQHYQSALELFKRLNFKIALLSSKRQEANFELPKTKKKKTEEISQTADLIIGTQSLIQDGVHFKKLALVVVDEQHRFGVNQRQEILKKNIDDNKLKTTPHFLSMTATPIPRTMALKSFSNLDFSIINQKPPGRLPIKTKIIKSESERQRTYRFIEEEIKKGRQAFIICPLIDPSDKFGARSVKNEYERLKQDEFPQIEMAMLHAKLKTEDKEEIMKKFSQNKIKIIVSTSVIEVGIDIKSATIMLIEGAERFGLSQLHQFRGRVGRSSLSSYCFLSLSPEQNNPKTIQRLESLEKYQDGLSIAKVDLENRGAGNFYGLEQSGEFNFRYASFLDQDIINKVEKEIKLLSHNDPKLKKHPQLRKKVQTSLEQSHLE